MRNLKSKYKWTERHIHFLNLKLNKLRHEKVKEMANSLHKDFVKSMYNTNVHWTPEELKLLGIPSEAESAME